ncbi:MAG: MlaD family protein [Chitinophagaceae bacterium]|nr:MlaD family protein [Chitinophagaceae bacterium]
MKYSKEVKIGILTITALFLFYYGFEFLKGVEIFKSTNTYLVIYEKVGGLKVSNSIVLSGFAVGKVSNITILQNSNNNVLVEFAIDKKIILGKNTKAKLYSTDFLGGKAIELIVHGIEYPISEYDTIPGEIEKEITESLQEKSDPLLKKIDTTITSINKIFTGFGNGGEKINESITHINEILIQNKKQIHEILISLHNTSLILEKTIPKVDALVLDANTSMKKINNIPIEKIGENLLLISHNLNTTIALINKGQGTIGKFLTQDDIYQNLNNTITNLDSVLVILRENPRHYFAPFGKKKKKK